MKRYKYNGHLFLFDPDKAPKGAVEVKDEKVEAKEAKPANKARKAASK